MTTTLRFVATVLLLSTASPAAAAPDPTDVVTNPRADNHGAGGIAVLFPAGAIGAWAEGRPHWTVRFGGGLGGLAWESDAGTLGVVSFWGDVALLPVPFMVTPELGFGLVRVVGDGADKVADGRVWTPIDDDLHRGTIYGRFGVRVDGRAKWTLFAGVGVMPPESGTAPVVMPSLRFGGRF